MINCYAKRYGENKEIIFEPVKTICGYPLEEAIEILQATTIERVSDIKVTMDNIEKITDIIKKDYENSMKNAMKRLKVETDGIATEIRIPKVEIKN